MPPPLPPRQGRARTDPRIQPAPHVPSLQPHVPSLQPHASQAELAETIAADAAFLSASGLLDYSLLVGIHRLPQLPAAEREARLAALEAQGGHASLDRQKVYFFGIIDVLERYTLRWQAQHTVLTAGYHLLCRADAAPGISVRARARARLASTAPT